ncbi:MAG: hypothetical protein IJG13_12590 [Kiritimatiellae bacterium]|nr:hypothetical protein [Kiritimatiellia bacterium]MBQ3345034.1 hypothetical protein [Kiritimatiellia bacterium]
MELWRAEEVEAKRPKVLDARSFGTSLAIHAAFFAICFGFAACHMRKDEVITPIDLTVVVVENLDGNPDEPPPLKKPEPEPPPPPPPKPQPKPKPKEPEKPKELEKIVTNIVEKVEKEKKSEAKPPEPPKKTKAELRKERIEKMRQSAKDTKRKVEAPKTPAPPQPNGRTDKKTLTDAEIQKLLNAGYRPGSTTNLAASEEQLCFSLIKQAFEAKWDEPPWTDTLRPMVIRVWFGGGGKVLKYKLEQSSGDPKADATIRSAASRVGVVSGLSADFIEKYGRAGVPIRFTVKPK